MSRIRPLKPNLSRTVASSAAAVVGKVRDAAAGGQGRSGQPRSQNNAPRRQDGEAPKARTQDGKPPRRRRPRKPAGE